jgi:hypothetical protein
VASATYTIGRGTINDGSGFVPGGVTLNGTAALSGTRLRLTDGGTSEASSAFFPTSVSIQMFTTDFQFQQANASADGFTFLIQGNGPTALGSYGEALGYSGIPGVSGSPSIPNSMAIKFDLYDNAGEGNNSTGLYTNGSVPTTPAIDLTNTGIDLHSGHVFAVHLTYDGTRLTMTITDTATEAQWTHSFPINIPATVGSPSAYVGFTGGTGGLSAIQDILTWTYSFPSQVAMPVFSPTGGSYAAERAVIIISDGTAGAQIYYTIDGTAPTPSSTLYTGPIALRTSTTIKAIGILSGWSPSAVATATYVVGSAKDDFDGDGLADIAVFRKSTDQWFVLNSGGGSTTQGWGALSLGDIAVPADYDGDGKTDIAVYRSSTGQWFILKSSGGSIIQGWGSPALGDIPVPADYDGDGKADLAVYRTSTGQWFILNSSGGSTTQGWGSPSLGDIPVPADYDGDGKTDIAVYRNSTGQWFILNSSGGATTQGWGSPALGDIPVPADYDGDGKADIAVYRNSTGKWFILKSSGGATTQGWGSPSLGDIPVPGDYDSDGKADIAVYRGNTGTWYILKSSGGSTIIGWGSPALGDTPIELPQALR